MSHPLVTSVLAAHALNGESPVWDGRRQRLFWVDIRAPALHEFDPATSAGRRWDMPSWIGCCAPCPDGVLVALRTGLHVMDLDTGALRFLAAAPFDSRRFIFNDGKIDPAGRFLVGPMYAPLTPGPPAEAARAAPLWRYGPDGWTPLSGPVSTSNGLAWSPDGRTIYHSDTEQRTIWARDYDPATGASANERVFARVEVADGGPDGAAVDRDGFYWCAVFANSRLLRFDPAGKLERQIEMPVRYPTMPAFGGEKLDTIFVTSATWPIANPDPAGPDGNLFALPAPVQGLAVPAWQPRSG